MIQTSVIFFDKNAEKNALPDTWSRYLIIESEAPWAGATHSIATVIPVTDAAPLPRSKDFLAAGGQGSATIKAIDALKQLDSLKSFKFTTSKS